MNVAVLGASDKPDRFSYKAVMKLKDHGHKVFPIHPKLETLEGLRVFAGLDKLPEAMDTLTLYVGPETSSKQIQAIVGLKARRVIFNPGTENPALEEALAAAGVRTVRDCTLLMLDGGRFE